MRSLQICPKKNSLYILYRRERRRVLILIFPREWNIQVAFFHYDLGGSQSSELIMIMIVDRVKSRRHKGRASVHGLASQGENGSYLPASIVYILQSYLRWNRNDFFFWPQLFKKWITLSTAIITTVHWIVTFLVSLTRIHRIVICPVDTQRVLPPKLNYKNFFMEIYGEFEKTVKVHKNRLMFLWSFLFASCRMNVVFAI